MFVIHYWQISEHYNHYNYNHVSFALSLYRLIFLCNCCSFHVHHSLLPCPLPDTETNVITAKDYIFILYILNTKHKHVSV